MSPTRTAGVVWANIRRNKRSFALASVGLTVGVATFTFFLSLGAGIQEGVLNRIYPVNRIEVEPASVGVVGLRTTLLDADALGPAMVTQLESLPGVVSVYPKMRARLQARLWGGKALFGHALRTEAFVDGMRPTLVHEEAQSLEDVDEKHRRHKIRRPLPCAQDEECPLGQECGDEGACRPVEYWSRFTHTPTAPWCEGKGETERCPEGQQCLQGQCRAPCGGEATCEEGAGCAPLPGCTGAACPTVCLPGCRQDGDCPITHECTRLGTETGTCQRLACRLDVRGAQSSDRPGDSRGRVMSRCANGVSPSDPTCEPLRCPGTSYCAAHNVTTDQGACELPLPVMLSPFLIEVFNSSVASSLGFQQLDGVDALLGARFRVHLGGSYFSDSLPRKQQVVKTAEVVGFSSKALDFGLTLPLETVRDLNTRFKGKDAARSYNTFILETRKNEDVSGLIAELEARGFTLSRKSQDARKAADLLFILTVVFGLISTVIMGVAAISITHTFLMMVSERRHEIGLMRALGATRGDIRALVLGEAAAVGVFGAITGGVVSYGLSRLANTAAAGMLERVPFRPEDLFQYDWRILVGAVIFAVVFAILGALAPARRAARLDPARVLVG